MKLHAPRKQYITTLANAVLAEPKHSRMASSAIVTVMISFMMTTSTGMNVKNAKQSLSLPTTNGTRASLNPKQTAQRTAK